MTEDEMVGWHHRLDGQPSPWIGHGKPNLPLVEWGAITFSDAF